MAKVATCTEGDGQSKGHSLAGRRLSKILGLVAVLHGAYSAHLYVGPSTGDAAELRPSTRDSVHPTAEQTRIQLTWRYGSMALAACATCTLGFLPAYVVGFSKRGGWYTDALSRTNAPDAAVTRKRWGKRWDVLISFHAIAALLWVILAMLQATSGMAMAPGGALRAWHKTGGYLALAAGCAFVFSAIALQLHKERPFGMWLPPIWINAGMVLFNLAVGIIAVRAGDFATHKAAMAWACLWSAAPGFVRLCNYAHLHLLGGTWENGGAPVTLGMAVLQVMHGASGMLSPGAALDRVPTFNALVVFLVLACALLQLVQQAMRAPLRPTSTTAAGTR